MFITFRSLFSVRKYFKRLPKQSKHPKVHTRGTRLSARFVGMYTIRFYMKKILFKWYLPFPPVTFIYLFFPNKYNWINTNNESSHWKVFPRKAAAPRSPKVKRVIFYKYRQDPWKSREKQPRRSSKPCSCCICNNKIVKRDLY